MVELVSLVLETLLTKDDTPVLAESCLFLGYYVLCLGSQSIQDDPEHHHACMAQTDGPVVLAQLEVAFLRKHNGQRLRPWSWPLTRILLQTMVSMSTTDSSFNCPVTCESGGCCHYLHGRPLQVNCPANKGDLAT